MTGHEKYLKRNAPTFAAFQKKQAEQKEKVKYQDTGIGPNTFKKPPWDYRKNRDIEIFKLSKIMSVKKVISNLHLSHLWLTDSALYNYVNKCIKRGYKLSEAR